MACKYIIGNIEYKSLDDLLLAFNPNQIKSATENIGTFDTTNPDIRFSVGEEKTAGEINQELIDRLKQNGLSEDVFLMSTEEIDAKLKELNEKDIKNIPNGFVYKNQVFLNKDTADDSVLLHEYNHLFTSWLKENKKELYNKGIDLVKKEVGLRNVNYELRRPSENKLIFVDPSKLLERLDKDEPSYSILDKNNQIGNRVEKAKDYLNKYLTDQRAIDPRTGERTKTILSFEPSLVSIYNDKLGFTDGRHRVLAAKELGLREVGIEIPIEQEELFKDLLSQPSEIQDIIDYVRTTQPTLTGEAFLEELLTEITGRRGSELLNSKKKSGIIDWIREAFKEIGKMLGLLEATPEEISKMTLKEFADASAVQMLKGSNISEIQVQKKTDEYLNRIESIKKQDPDNYWSVDIPSRETIEDAIRANRLVETEGGMAIVEEDGNMVGLFKDSSTAKNVAKTLQEMRVQKGGFKMDNFDGYLTKIYEKNGFRVVSRLAFNDAEGIVPPDWNKEKHGTPDVVFMIYDPKSELNIEEKSFDKDSYNEAKAYRDSFSEEAKAIHPYYKFENNSQKTQDFFSDVVSGKSEKYKAKKPWTPLLTLTKAEDFFNKIYSKFKGNFDNHIATSIPTFRETQVKVGSAIVNMLSYNVNKKTTKELVDLKDKYMSDNKLTQKLPYSKVDYNFFNALADYHKNIEDDRSNKVMEESYRAFLNETKKQYELLVRAGYTIEPWLGEGEPYGVYSDKVREDVINNKHLYYLRSRSATGENNENEDSESYMPFEDSGIVINGDKVLMNDLFRAVHDIMGHVMVHNTFSTQGEFDAYVTHSQMYSEKAQKALFLETVVYNAWYSKNKNYAPRKIYDIPSEFLNKVKENKLVYDIGGSEGGFVKAITEVSNGQIETINLDPNPEMEKAHNSSPVKGSTFVREAFYESFEDDGVVYKKHVPSKKADVVHESMVFQFITPERRQFIKEIKDNYLKKDGIILLEEKLVPNTTEEWIFNEERKDEYKRQYYSQEVITEKAEQVLTGMFKNQTKESDLLSILNNEFSYVGEYWDAGNFKGYIATNSKTKFDQFFIELGGKIVSEYSSKINIQYKKAPQKPIVQVGGAKVFAKKQVNATNDKPTGRIELDLITSENRGSGEAREAMKQFLQIMDANKQEVFLTVSPRDKETSFDRLVKFYESFGFRLEPSGIEMVRRPKKVIPPTEDKNGEAKADEVIKFSKTTDEKLSKEELIEAMDAAVSLGVETSEELLENLDFNEYEQMKVDMGKVERLKAKLKNTPFSVPLVEVEKTSKVNSFGKQVPQVKQPTLPVQTVDENGTIVDKLSDTKEVLQLTYPENKKDNLMPKLVGAIQKINNEIFNENTKLVYDVIQDIKEEALDFGVDLKDIENRVFPFQKLKDFLSALQEYTINPTAEFAKVYDEFFNVEPLRAYKPTFSSEYSEYELYDKFNLIRVGDIYQKVETPVLESSTERQAKIAQLQVDDFRTDVVKLEEMVYHKEQLGQPLKTLPFEEVEAVNLREVKKNPYLKVTAKGVDLINQDPLTLEKAMVYGYEPQVKETVEKIETDYSVIEDVLVTDLNNKSKVRTPLGVYTKIMDFQNKSIYTANLKNKTVNIKALLEKSDISPKIEAKKYYTKEEYDKNFSCL